MTTQYQVLARKYRPKSFHELLGQTHVSTALANAIDTGRLHHAYLFTGTRGVGKTTIARILAKCLNCETGMTSQPCGVCETCQSIDAGRFLDLIEIDAASRTKVEDTRDLLENVPYAPVQGRYKVYLIDEVHMLSTHSFNALLKTLEEPPEHVKFIFATTDPQKLPITIISRCLQFVLRPLPQTLLAQHLAVVLDKEGVQYHPSALWQLAHSARGSVRDALSLTDQAIAFGGGQIADETVGQMLGLIDGADVLGLIADIYHDDRTAVGATIEALRAKMVDAALILDALTERLHQMALVQVLPDVPLDMNDDDKKRLVALSAVIPAEVLQLYYEIVGKSKEGLKFANTPMQGLEMAILRLLAFRPLEAGQAVQGSSLSNHASRSHATPLSGATLDLQGADDTAEQAVSAQVTADLPANEHLEGTPSQAVTTEPSQKLNQTPQQTPSHATPDHQRAYSEPEHDVADQNPANNQAALMAIANDEIQMQEAVEKVREPRELAVGGLAVDEQIDEMFGEPQAAPQSSLDFALKKERPLEEGLEGDIPTSPSVLLAETGLETELTDGLEAELTAHLANNSHAKTQITPQGTHPPSNEGSVGQGEVASYGEMKANHQAMDVRPYTQNAPAVPINQMLMPPACVLEGAWDDDKWDFWTHGAYAKGLLSADEFALVQNAVVVGQIQGEARLKVSDVQYQIELSFKHLKEKIKSDLGTELSLDETPIDMRATPQKRQEARQEMALFSAKKALADSPVMQRLAAVRVLAGEDGLSSLSQARLLL